MTFVNDLKSSPHVIIFFARETFLSFLWRDLGNNSIDEIKRMCAHTHTHIFNLSPFYHTWNQNFSLKFTWNSAWLPKGSKILQPVN